ncbi:MAG: Ureidoglycolate hydrolase [Phormidesmis sp. RL_2_1]|nr:Ureidoglycolate hydrolase [Phormidesmis sp. RL_2_1]
MAQSPKITPEITPKITPIEAIPITNEAFCPFGQVIWPQPDDLPFHANDAQLQLQNGTPRFYIMQLHQRGRRFHDITCHQACTQCLGSLDGREWFLGVAPPNADQLYPYPEDIRVFKIPGNCFVKLAVGTWHAGPYFDDDTINFYNLELSDTNVVDHTTCDLSQTYGVTFEIV